MFSFQLLEMPSFQISELIIEQILKQISQDVSISQSWTLNIVFLDDQSIQKLNKDYRNIDKTTDVLSFHYYDDFSQLDIDEVAWEIIMSQSKISSQAAEYKLGEEYEFYKLFIHSVLHILWYDHEEEQEYIIMQALEDKIWEELFGKS